MKKLILLLAVIVSLQSFSQKNEKVLVADETWIVQSTNSFRIITSNDSIYLSFLKSFGNSFTHLSIDRKKDRKGEFFEYSLSIPKEGIEKAIKLLKEINKE